MTTSQAGSGRDYQVVLVLGGGNALGAYQGGVYQALLEHGVEIDWLVGASAGAVNGAIIAGNPAELRIERLKEYWRPREGGSAAALHWSGLAEDARRTIGAHMAFTLGQPHIFVPRRLFGPWWEPFGNAEPSSLYDTSPIAATLAKLVDFDRLNSGDIRFTVTAVELERGREAVFDTRQRPIRAEHLRASSALLPAFPPVEIDGTLFADAGVSANLPLDVVLSEPPPGPTLCLAIDLLPLKAPPPRTLGNAAERMQDLMFATQSRRAIEAWQRFYDLRSATTADKDGDQPAVTLVHLAYGAQEPEVCGKAFDFSPESAAYRWEQGHRDMAHVLKSVEAGELAIGKAGLTVHAFQGQEPA